jgi:hypothetical protein
MQESFKEVTLAGDCHCGRFRQVFSFLVPLPIYCPIMQRLASRILLLGRLLVTSHLSRAPTTTIGLWYSRRSGVLLGALSWTHEG